MVVILDFIIKTNGLDLKIGTSKVGFRDKKGTFLLLPLLLFIRIWVFSLGEVVQWSGSFWKSFRDHVESSCQIWSSSCFGSSKEIEQFGFWKWAHRSQKWWSNSKDFFLLLIYQDIWNQPLRFHHIAISDVLNTINSLDLDCGADKVGFHNKNLLLPGYYSIAFQRLCGEKIRRGRWDLDF